MNLTHLISMNFARVRAAEACSAGQGYLEGFVTTLTISGSKWESNPEPPTSSSETFLIRSDSTSSAAAPVRPSSSSMFGVSLAPLWCVCVCKGILSCTSCQVLVARQQTYKQTYYSVYIHTSTHLLPRCFPFDSTRRYSRSCLDGRTTPSLNFGGLLLHSPSFELLTDGYLQVYQLTLGDMAGTVEQAGEEERVGLLQSQMGRWEILLGGV